MSPLRREKIESPLTRPGQDTPGPNSPLVLRINPRPEENSPPGGATSRVPARPEIWDPPEIYLG